MDFFDRLALVVVGLLAYGAYVNALEAHRHTHELACHISGAEDLCRYHLVQP